MNEVRENETGTKGNEGRREGETKGREREREVAFQY
jgi:hypothetical protein